MFNDLLTCLQVCGIPFPDTQCGFKLFTRPSARALFNNTHIKRFDLLVLFFHLTPSTFQPPDPRAGVAPDFGVHSRNSLCCRFAFDVEVLFLAVQANLKCADQEIEWTEVGGSTISSFTMFQMLKDILLMRCAYAFGFWRQKVSRGNKDD
jgi:hypothetical protein